MDGAKGLLIKVIIVGALLGIAYVAGKAAAPRHLPWVVAYFMAVLAFGGGWIWTHDHMEGD